jgi:hypothetical protein
MGSYRLLGQSHNRLVTVVDSEPNRDLGQVSTIVGEQLVKAGWTPYVGPAHSKGGWVVPDTDPQLHPRALKHD